MLRKLAAVTPRARHLCIAMALSACVGIFFYFWHPDAKDDLFRYFAWMDLLRELKGEQLFHFIISRAELVTMAYAYIIAQIGNYGLFQLFPTVAMLFIVQYIAIDYASRKNIHYKYAWAGIAVFFCFYEIFMVVSGVRSPLGYAIITLAIYREYILQKKRAWWLYVLAILIHLGMIIPTMVRLIFSVKNKKAQLVVIGAIFLVLILPVGSAILGLLGPVHGADAITVSLYKLGNYLLPSFPVSLPYFYKIGKLLIISTLFFYVYRRRPNNKYIAYFSIIALLTYPMLDSYFLWYRMLELLIIASPIVVMESLRVAKVRWRQYVLCSVLIIAALVGVRVQSAYFLLDTFKLQAGPMLPRQGWKL